MRSPPESPSALQDLLDRIECGSIEDAAELSPQDIELLRRYYGSEEDLAELLDRLRGSDRD